MGALPPAAGHSTTAADNRKKRALSFLASITASCMLLAQLGRRWGARVFTAPYRRKYELIRCSTWNARCTLHAANTRGHLADAPCIVSMGSDRGRRRVDTGRGWGSVVRTHFSVGCVAARNSLCRYRETSRRQTRHGGVLSSPSYHVHAYLLAC